MERNICVENLIYCSQVGNFSRVSSYSKERERERERVSLFNDNNIRTNIRTMIFDSKKVLKFDFINYEAVIQKGVSFFI